MKMNNKLSGPAFQNAAQHLEDAVVNALHKSAEREGREDLWKTYLEARELYLRFLKERRYDLALRLEARYRPN